MVRTFYSHTSADGDNLKLVTNIPDKTYDIYVNDEYVVSLNRCDISYVDARTLMFQLYYNTDYFNAFTKNNKEDK